MSEHHATSGTEEVPSQPGKTIHQGSEMMPAWDVGELPTPPTFTLKDWASLLGPGLVMGGAAIGGGEWVTGPLVTAKYGGALLWLATLSIVGQVFYNLEISRYTLYSGEPIFTGKFRVPPGPIFWMCLYLFLDFGSVIPYLAASAASPLAAVLMGHVADINSNEPAIILGWTAQLGSYVITEKRLMFILSYVVFYAAILPLLFGGKVYNSVKAIMTFKVFVVLGYLLFLAFFFSNSNTWMEICGGFFQFGSVPVNTVAVEGEPAKFATENIFINLLQGRPFPAMELSMIGVIAGMAAISGSGGLTNTTVSTYTRDQGWGMGRHVGAIPSLVGGRNIALSHTGMVFQITAESMKKWKGWMNHVLRDQLVVWMPACFVGLGLPAMLSMQFLERGTTVKDNWVAASMTAQGVGNAVAAKWGEVFNTPFFYFTLACGVLVLWPSAITTIDGFLRRWVDVVWVGIPAVRTWETRRIGQLYLGVLITYTLFGSVALSFGEPRTLLTITTTLYNFALGVSCWQTLVLNTTLLPVEIRPGWFKRVGLVFAGCFFFGLGLLTTWIKWNEYLDGVTKNREAQEKKAKTALVIPAEQFLGTCSVHHSL
jgi:hypothetical protein